MIVEIVVRADTPEELPWSAFHFSRCKARRLRTAGDPYFGRCDLKHGHAGEHALDRGMDVIHVIRFL